MALKKVFIVIFLCYWNCVFSADSVFVFGKYSFGSNISRDEGCWRAEQNAIVSATSKSVSQYLYSDKELRCLETVTGKNDCSYHHTLTSNSLRAVLSFSKKNVAMPTFLHHNCNNASAMQQSFRLRGRPFTVKIHELGPDLVLTTHR